MTIQRPLAILMGYLLALLLMGCAAEPPDPLAPVRIVEPASSQALPLDGVFRVRAEIDTTLTGLEPHDVQAVEVELFNHATGEVQRWLVEDIVPAQVFTLDETFAVDAHLSPGLDYSLSVSALPNKPGEPKTSGQPAFGYSQRVVVLPRMEIVEPGVTEASPTPSVTTESTSTLTMLEAIGVPGLPSTPDTPDLSNTDITTQTLASPDGEWLAEVILAWPKPSNTPRQSEYYQQLSIRRADGSARFEPIRLWSPAGLGYTYPVLQQWSANGESVYFATQGVPDGCGVFTGPADLRRFDTATNTVTQITGYGGWPTLSPDETQVAFFTRDGLVIMDLATRLQRRTERQTDLSAPMGEIAWSPDGTSIAYTIAHNPCVGGWTESTSIVVVEVGTVDEDRIEETVLVEQSEQRWITDGWVDDETILLLNQMGGTYATLDVDTGTLVPSETTLRTPSPTGEWTASTDPQVGSLLLQPTDYPFAREIFPPGGRISAVAWSPDGRYLLVEQRNWTLGEVGQMPTVSDEPLRLWRVEVDDASAGEPSLLFEAPSSGPAPSQIVFGDWSPTGRDLLFWYGMNSASMQADGFPMARVDVETGEVTLLAESALLYDDYRSWSPDGTALVYTAGGGRVVQSNKWLMLWPGGDSQPQTIISDTEQISGAVAWLPTDEDLIAYVAIDAADAGDGYMSFDNPAIDARHLYLLEPSTGEHERLNDIDVFQDGPRWSADGQTLCYAQRDGNEVQLVTVDPYDADSRANPQPVPDTRRLLPNPDTHFLHPETPDMYYGRIDWSELSALCPK